LFWTASCSKLLTSLAAIQLVHRDLWTWTRPITDIIPELRSLRILTGWSADKTPVFSSDTSFADKISLLHLLTHTSGLAYDFLSPDILKYKAWIASQNTTTPEQPPAPTATPQRKGSILDLYLTPLLAAPGSQWAYSPSIDFAGLLVSRLTSQSLGDYIRANILAPCGVEDPKACAYRASDFQSHISADELKERWVYLSMRNPDGKGGMIPVPGRIGDGPTDKATEDLGGGGMRCAPKDYMKVLESLVRNDGKILPSQWVSECCFGPQFVDGAVARGGQQSEGLGSHLRASLQKVFGTIDGGGMLSGGLPLPVEGRSGSWDGAGWEYDHSLVGCLARRKGGDGGWALHWGGLPNLFWFVDPQEQVEGLLAMQILPPADPTCVELARRFREAAIDTLGKSAKGGSTGQTEKEKAADVGYMVKSKI
jgi:CubicO group peptidase (beta-lactamase class C family)